MNGRPFLFAVVQLNHLYSGLQLINQPTVQSTFLLIISPISAKLSINNRISYFHNMSGWCFGYYY